MWVKTVCVYFGTIAFTDSFNIYIKLIQIKHFGGSVTSAFKLIRKLRISLKNETTMFQLFTQYWYF